MPDRLSDRINTTVLNIMSGNNECGTLEDAVKNQSASYFAQMVAPALEVYDEELKTIIEQRDEALKDAEVKRYALETIVANIDLSGANTVITDAIKAALPNNPFFK